MLVAAAGTGVTALESCSPEPCTMEAVPSVEVEVVDTDGRPIPAREVWYRAASGDAAAIGGDTRQAECADPRCTTWYAGREIEGDIVVHAAACGDVKARHVSVPLGEDDCHVNTQRLRLAFDCGAPSLHDPNEDGEQPRLTPLPNPPLIGCDATPRPSIRVNVVEADTGAMLPADAVRYTFEPTRPDRVTSVEPQPQVPVFGEGVCVTDLCAGWEVGTERAGTFQVWADACGNQSEIMTVEVDEDTCHVDTREFNLDVQCSPDVRDRDAAPTTPA